MSQEVKLFTKPDCKLCDDAKAMLETYQLLYSFKIVEHNIEEKEEWLEQYFLTIPVVRVAGEELDAHQMTMDCLEQFLQQHFS